MRTAKKKFFLVHSTRCIITQLTSTYLRALIIMKLEQIPIIAQEDHIASLTQASPIQAIAELIWNGFDASSSDVKVILDYNALERLENIRIKDTGYGISLDKVKDCFGSLGDSWKKAQKYQDNRALHGKNGKGRLKAFGLGSYVEWNTTFEKDHQFYNYTILGNLNNIKNFQISEQNKSDIKLTGTEVTVSNLYKNYTSLTSGNAILELAKIFAVYLTEYPNLSLEFDGNKVDPFSVQNFKKDYDLSEDISGITNFPIWLTIIEWKIDTDRVLNLCDSNGITLDEYSLKQKIRAPGFNFTAYLKSDYIRELDSQNILSLGDLEPSLQIIIPAAISKIREHFRKRLSEKNGQIIDKWKEEKIYPYEEKTSLTPVETIERQVFDILAVNVQTFLPNFEDTDKKNKKFTFKLLAQAIAQNPDSVQTIITEVLDLKKDEQDQLAKLLSKTSLSSIISSASIVANRLNFLNGFESLLFQEQSKKIFLERDQLHKMLEQEAWLFHEEFALSASEKRLEDVLEKHIGKLGDRGEPVLLPDGKTGRIDMLLSKVNQPRDGEFDYLVVELKRPTKKIDSDVISQVKKYAMAVANDERFKGEPAKWTFIAISNDMDEYAHLDATQRDKPKGMIWDHSDLNITVWVKTWAEIIGAARAKLNFINDKLEYKADHESAIEYLEETHNKFIPRIED